jgi:glycosyltransferase involved in cell wall biosynthesis
VKQSDIFNFISKGSATIIPHYRSVQNDCSSPNKLYQYMFVGKPVISSDCESLERVINSINSGLIYKDTSAKDLSSKIQQLMNDKELQLSLGQNGRLAVLDQYNTDCEKAKLIKAYSDLV